MLSQRTDNEEHVKTSDSTANELTRVGKTDQKEFLRCEMFSSTVREFHPTRRISRLQRADAAATRPRGSSPSDHRGAGGTSSYEVCSCPRGPSGLETEPGPAALGSFRPVPPQEGAQHENMWHLPPFHLPFSVRARHRNSNI
ncbi:hypothetical protein EYF80_054043 [Liparis tanakae]|uniref:Uncharacterized protein n=1 Tax=Liparis tanakae TaxID=230148 RepID=A0A4Z2F3R1_9TELE|nr:hypothetical protein EYF80_054043 [Liparis tanakae]